MKHKMLNLSINIFLFQVVVTNTVPHDLQKLQCHKIKTVDISILLAEVCIMDQRAIIFF